MQLSDLSNAFNGRSKRQVRTVKVRSHTPSAPISAIPAPIWEQYRKDSLRKERRALINKGIIIPAYAMRPTPLVRVGGDWKCNPPSRRGFNHGYCAIRSNLPSPVLQYAVHHLPLDRVY